MTRITYSVTEARNQFSALIRRMEEEQQPIYITRYGQVVAVISPINEYERLITHQPQKNSGEVKNQFDG